MLPLPQSFIDEMIAHAREDAPIECCGMIAGEEGRAVKLLRMTNVEASKYKYRVDGQEQYNFLKMCNENGWEFLAIYHSHTASEAYPSPTDVRLAEFWPDPHYVLVSLQDADKPVVRAFRILDGAISEEEIVAA